MIEVPNKKLEIQFDGSDKKFLFENVRRVEVDHEYYYIFQMIPLMPVKINKKCVTLTVL